MMSRYYCNSGYISLAPTNEIFLVPGEYDSPDSGLLHIHNVRDRIRVTVRNNGPVTGIGWALMELRDEVYIYTADGWVEPRGDISEVVNVRPGSYLLKLLCLQDLSNCNGQGRIEIVRG